MLTVSGRCPSKVPPYASTRWKADGVIESDSMSAKPWASVGLKKRLVAYRAMLLVLSWRVAGLAGLQPFSNSKGRSMP